MFTQKERISSARKVIEGLLRARRAIRIYPDGSPVTTKAVDDLYADLRKFLAFQDRISFEILQDVILFELEEIFHSASQENNISLFLFRDGIREVTFKKGLTRNEVLGFVHVVSSGGAHEVTGEDIVTRMWEHDFKHIRCIVYETEILTAAGPDESAGRSGPGIKDFPFELLRAHQDALSMKEEEGGVPDVMEFSDEDLILLRKEIDRNPADKTGKLLAVALELFLLAETEEECGEIEAIMKKALDHALAKGQVEVLADFFMNVKMAYIDTARPPRFRENLSRIFSFFSSERFLAKVGSLLDGGLRLDEETFGKLTRLLDKRSIPVLITLLGYLDTISARKTIVNMLSSIGKSDISAITECLGDGRWYVVRNVVIVLRNIGSTLAKRHLLKIVDHKDPRVRREAVKALAQISGGEAIDVLSQALDDRDQSVRQAALGALTELGILPAKKILLERIQSSSFLGRDYEEKKDYFRALLTYNDDDVSELLGKILLKKSTFRKMKNDENRAALTYSIGVKGDKAYLPFLYKLDDSKNELLQRAAAEAIRKIENGH
jgi:HEAT repeat protein